MQKTVISLCGKGDVGKTDTIQEVYRLLRLKYEGLRLEVIEEGEDIKAILTIKGVKNWN